MLKKFSALEDKAGKVISDVSGVTSQIKENPSVLLRGPKEKPASRRADQAGSGRAARSAGGSR